MNAKTSLQRPFEDGGPSMRAKMAWALLSVLMLGVAAGSICFADQPESIGVSPIVYQGPDHFIQVSTINYRGPEPVIRVSTIRYPQRRPDPRDATRGVVPPQEGDAGRHIGREQARAPASSENPPVFGARTRVRVPEPKSIQREAARTANAQVLPADQAPVPIPKPSKEVVAKSRPDIVNQRHALAKPVITYPSANATFTMPVDFTVRANVAAGLSVTYGLREPERNRVVAKNTSGRFQKLVAGQYCAYVRYDPNGPESVCVPFRVRLAVEQSRKGTGALNR